MRLSTKIAYNTIIQIASKVISTALGLVAVGLIARYLGQAGFGQYTIVLAFLSVFAILADLGLTLVTVQMISRPGVNQDEILNNLFTLRLISAVFFLALGVGAVLFFPYENIVKIGVAVTSFSFVFIALNQILVGLFQKELRMDKDSLAEIMGKVFLVAGVFLSVNYLKSNDDILLGVLAATVTASMVNFLLHFYFARRFVKIKLRFNKKVWREIMQRSWPLAIIITLNLIYLKGDTLILSLFRDAAEVGVYGATYRVIEVLTTVPFILAGLVLPIMTASWIKKDNSAFHSAMQRSFDLMMIIILPVIVGGQLVSRQVMILVAGPEFEAAGPVLQILVLAAGFVFFGVIFSHAVIAFDRQRILIKPYIFISLVSLVGYFIFIPMFSYFGAAWMTVISEMLAGVVALYFTWKISRFFPNFKVVMRALAASIAMAVAIYFLPEFFYQSNLGLLMILIIAAFVYFPLLFIFGGISKNDLKDLLNL